MRKITLTQRSDGRFAKRIDGEYFIWPDEQTARAAIIELARRREAGVSNTALIAMPSDPPLRVLANLFRDARRPHVQPGTWADYETAIDQFLTGVGKYRTASSLSPGDFQTVRDKWAKALGPWKLDNRVQSVHSMFRWANRVARLIDREPWYGDSFRKTTTADKRRARRLRTAENGERMFNRSELKVILNAAAGPLRAFVLLGLNGGMYAADIAQMEPADLRKEGKLWIIDNERHKTGMLRKLVLWPETIKAMECCRRGTDRLFVTSHGNPWVNGETNSVMLLFGRLLADLKIKRPGVNFGAFKHTHISAVGDHHDLDAARLVRGHDFGAIESHYDFPSIARIKAVTDLARTRLVTNVLRKSSSGSRPA
jgi:integrase